MGSYKKIGWTDADVRCPFYITDDRETRSISCEGFGKGVDAVSRFQTTSTRFTIQVTALSVALKPQQAERGQISPMSLLQSPAV